MRLMRLKRPKGPVGTESDCLSQKSALKAQKAQKVSGVDGNRLPVRRKMLRTKRTMRTKGGRGQKAIGHAGKCA